MAEFVRKSPIGYKAVPGGESDPDCTHVILLRAEYRKLLKDKEDASRRAWTAEEDVRIVTQRKEAEQRNAVNYVQEQARKELDEVLAELEQERQESDYQRRLNANLLRISRERANADRKLRPKKAHTGYVVAFSAERVYFYTLGTKKRYKAILWETTLQSPYSIEFTEEQARRLMDEFFMEDDTGRWPPAALGIDDNYGLGFEAMLRDEKWREYAVQHNVVLERRIRANFKAGYWETVLLHTKPLGLVPENMRIS